ncbi:MAG: hypothetical protein K2L21_06270 [Muribaculaceae bacterium]|nr:hypothetical protein [Muribaculaceae bacterium]
MRLILFISLLSLGSLLTGCFTGVESTPPITDREVRKSTPPPSPDDNYLSAIRATRVKELRPGMKWIVNDSRISRVFGAEAYDKHFAPGDTLTLRVVRPALTLDGRKVGEVVFSGRDVDSLVYRTSISYDTFLADSALSLPFAVEGALVDAVGQLMTGKEYYLITSSRFDMADVAYTGRKFVPVTVEEVTYGNSYYPVSLILRDDRDERFRLHMSVDGASVMPRKFSSLLSLTDPRLSYPDTTDDVWDQIVNGKVKIGMTTNECRLSLGRPADVVRQAGYSSLVEIWTYAGGRYLVFTDGILTSVR